MYPSHVSHAAHRLFYVSNLAGAAGAAIFICSYQRVACHLQDPLKGFCLAFAIVFYFLFCKKGLLNRCLGVVWAGAQVCE